MKPIQFQLYSSSTKK